MVDAADAPAEAPVERLDAVTLAVTDMARSVAFYENLGFGRASGGGGAAFTTLRAGPGFLNLQHQPAGPNQGGRWGRVIFFVDDVDAMHRRAVAAGLHPETAPADAPWGERYFHLRDPDGHELSFARPIR
jgi:catechol 2,3-dioxygenase-like lactoylglutathione lyase family enzyme